MPDKRHTRHFIPAEDAIPQIYFESPGGDGIVASDALRSDGALALLNKDDYAYPHSVGAKVTIVVEGPDGAWRFACQKHARRTERDSAGQVTVPHSKQKALQQLAKVLYAALEKHVKGNVHEQMKSIIIYGLKQTNTSSYQCILRWPSAIPTTIPPTPSIPLSTPLLPDARNASPEHAAWPTHTGQQIVHSRFLEPATSATPDAALASYEGSTLRTTTYSESWAIGGRPQMPSVMPAPTDLGHQAINSSSTTPVAHSHTSFFPQIFGSTLNSPPAPSYDVYAGGVPVLPDMPIDPPVVPFRGQCNQASNGGGALPVNEYKDIWEQCMQLPFDDNAEHMQNSFIFSSNVDATIQNTSSESTDSVQRKAEGWEGNFGRPY